MKKAQLKAETVGTRPMMKRRASPLSEKAATSQKSRMPLANLSKKEYIPYTKAALLVSFPITSLMREVPVLSMSAIPSPCMKDRGYTNHLSAGSSVKKANGKDPKVVIKADIKRGIRRFLYFWVMVAWRKTEKSMEAR